MERVSFFTNQRLLSLIAEDHEAAFMEIYDRYWQKVFSIAFNRLKNTQDAEDIVHDVFVSLWANRAKLHIDILENYLATAAKYQVLTRVKLAQKEATYKHFIQTETSTIVENCIEKTLHNKRILAMIKTEVEKLPQKCRIIFKYSRNEGMTVKQIASIMNISPKTVENQLGRAIKQLRIALQTFLPLFQLLFALFY